MGQNFAIYGFERRRGPGPAGAASYTGPGDKVPGAIAWGGLRAYSAATIGSNAVELRRDSDNTAQTFVTLANGSLDVASITTFKGAANLFLRTLYDQTGNGNHWVQATNSSQLSFLLNDLNGLPTIDGSGLKPAYQTSGTFTQAQPISCSAVMLFDTAAGVSTFGGDDDQTIYLGRRGSQAIAFGGGEIGPTGVSAAWHTYQVVLNGASSVVCLDGADTTGSAGTNGLASNKLSFFGDSTGGALWEKKGTELGYWFSGFTSQNRTDLDANQSAYYGI